MTIIIIIIITLPRRQRALPNASQYKSWLSLQHMTSKDVQIGRLILGPQGGLMWSKMVGLQIEILTQHSYSTSIGLVATPRHYGEADTFTKVCGATRGL